MREDEGYIKFKLNWENKIFNFDDHDFDSINTYRKKLFEMGLIGAYPDGIGFGNLSIRTNKTAFIISGSATGNIKDLQKNHFSLVTKYDLAKNTIYCQGLSKASSESLSHAAIFESNSNANSIMHIHHSKLWNTFRNKLPTTDPKAEFGTPEIAFEIKRLATEKSGVIVMGGHPEGLIIYGNSFDETHSILLNYYNKI